MCRLVADFSRIFELPTVLPADPVMKNTRTFGGRCVPYHVNVTIEINVQTIYIMYITSIKIIILLISF